jgi:hypothetical protein
MGERERRYTDGNGWAAIQGSLLEMNPERAGRAGSVSD